MAGSRKLTVEILGDAKGLGKAFGDAEKSAKDLGDGIGDLDAKNSDKFANVNKVIAGAGLAIGAFAVKGVMDFEKLGLEVGKFKDSTGLSAEESSRWIEVAGDHGIASDTLESAIGRLNKTAGTSPQTFKDMGVDIVYAKDGAVDANETFLATIERLNGIKDPAERAEAGTRLLGKGWMETAELVGEGSDSIRRELDAVAGSKVLTDDDVGTARGLRGAFDAIGDAVDELLLSLGKNLAPAIVEISDVIVDIVDAAGPLVDIIGTALTNALDDVKPLLEGVGEAIEFVGEVMPTANAGLQNMEDIFAANESTLRDAGVDVAELFEKIETGTISAGEFATVIQNAGGSLEVVDGIAFTLTGSIDGLTEAQREAKDATTLHNEALVAAYEKQYAAGEAAREQGVKLEESQQAAQRARDEQWRLADAAARVEQKVREQDTAWDLLFGTLDAQEALANIDRQFEDMVVEIANAQKAFEDGEIGAQEYYKTVQAENLQAKQDVAAYTKEVLGLPPERATQFLAMIDQGNLDAVEQRLAILTKNRTMQLSIEAKGATGRFTVSSTINAFDAGGIVPGPRGAARLILAHGGETVLPTHKTSGSFAGGGDTYIFNGPIMGEEDFVRRLEDARQDAIRRGAILVS